MDGLIGLLLIVLFLWLLFGDNAGGGTTHYVMTDEQKDLMEDMRTYAGSVGLSREAFFWVANNTPGDDVNLGDWMNFVDAHRDAWFEHVETTCGNYNSRKAWNKAFLAECCKGNNCPLHNKAEE